MNTLYDLGIEVSHIREALDSLEVKGYNNVSILNYAFGKCNEIIEAINQIAAAAENQNGSQEVVPDGIEDSSGILE